MPLEKVCLLRDYVRTHPEHEGKEYVIPKNAIVLSDVCCLDGSPVIATKENPLIIKVGKHCFLKIILEGVKNA